MTESVVSVGLSTFPLIFNIYIYCFSAKSIYAIRTVFFFFFFFFLREREDPGLPLKSVDGKSFQISRFLCSFAILISLRFHLLTSEDTISVTFQISRPF